MKKIILSLLIAGICAASLASTNEIRLNIRATCCRFEGWKGIELSIPNVPYSAQTNFILQYKNSLNQSNWINVVPDPIYGPFVEDGTWYYYYYYATPTNNGVNQRFWRIVE